MKKIGDQNKERNGVWTRKVKTTEKGCVVKGEGGSGRENSKETNEKNDNKGKTSTKQVRNVLEHTGKRNVFMLSRSERLNGFPLLFNCAPVSELVGRTKKRL